VEDRMKFYCFIILSICQFLFGLSFESIFPEITGPVYEIKYGSVENLGKDGYFFVTPDSGLVYYDYTPAPEFHQSDILPVVSATCLSNYYVNNKIYCALGAESYSDGIYSFDTYTKTFTLETWLFHPNFITCLSSGFYAGASSSLIHSADGTSWQDLEYFTNYDVKGIVETSDGKLFVSVIKNGSIAEVIMKSGDHYSNIGTPIEDKFNCIYYRKSGDYEEVMVTIGTGIGGMDGLYRVNFNDTDIIGIDKVFGYSYADQIFSYLNYYILSRKDSPNLIAIPHSGGSSISIGHGLDINHIYSFSEYNAIYTPNFLIATDKGVFLATGTVGIEDSPVPISTELHQNYPNPFNPETEIRYSLKSEGQVMLSVFNTKGELVSTLVNEKKSAGNHSLNFNGDGFNSGIYFYRLNVDGKAVQSRKMMVLK
jgi:hypothetical protein